MPLVPWRLNARTADKIGVLRCCAVELRFVHGLCSERDMKHEHRVNSDWNSASGDPQHFVSAGVQLESMESNFRS